MLVDLKDCDSLNKSDNIKVICVGGWRHCGWQRQPEGGYHGGRWHHDVSLQSKSLGFYSPLLTSVSSFSLMLMSWTLIHWCCHTIWSSQTLLNAPTISTAYHTLTLIDWRIFKLKWYIMMSNGCPCHPQLQCLRPSTLMTLRMSDMLKLEKHRKSCKRCPAQVSWKVKVKCQINSACRSGLSRPFCLPCLYPLSCLPFCGFSFRR